MPRKKSNERRDEEFEQWIKVQSDWYELYELLEENKEKNRERFINKKVLTVLQNLINDAQCLRTKLSLRLASQKLFEQDLPADAVITKDDIARMDAIVTGKIRKKKQKIVPEEHDDSFPI